MANKLTPESILIKGKYRDLKNLVLICEAMEEYFNAASSSRKKKPSKK